MGILAESQEEDVGALTWVIQLSLRAWDIHCQNSGETLRVELNDHLLPNLSLAGGKVIKMEFPNPSLFDRIAALLVVTNCSPLFKMSRNGQFLSNIQERRIFLSKITPAFVKSALIYFQPNRAEGYFSFDNIEDESAKYRFCAFLERLDSVEFSNVTATTSEKLSQNEQHAHKVLARDIISVVNFLTPNIKFIKGQAPDTLSIKF
jgi:hypothetical protein